MALPLLSAAAAFFRAIVRILCTVPRDTPILRPASSCVRSSRSQSLKASNSSRDMDIVSTSDIGMPVGLNAFPLKLHWQCRGFLHRGDMSIPSYFVHMHIMITNLPDVVKCFLQAFPVTFIFPWCGGRRGRRNLLIRSTWGRIIVHGIIASLLAIFAKETILFDYELFPTSLRVYTDYQDPLLMVCSNQR